MCGAISHNYLTSSASKSHAMLIWSVNDLLPGSYQLSMYNKVLPRPLILQQLICIFEIINFLTGMALRTGEC